MKSKKYIILATLVLFSIFLSACSSAVYASTGWHGLNAGSDTVYLAAGTQVYAIDPATGNEKWRYPAKVNAKISFYAAPVLTPDGQLLVPSFDHKLYSLDPTSGSEKWVFPNATTPRAGSSNRLVASPLVTKEMIYQPSTDHSIYAIDFKGNKVWSKETGGPLWANPVTHEGCGCVYVASMDHSVYAFDAANGNLLWQSADLGGAIVGTPAIDKDGTLFVGTFGKELIALDGTTGKVKWRYNTADWVWAGPALDNEVLYFGDLSGYFYALNAADGTAKWRIQPDDSIVSTPAISGDKIYITTKTNSLYIVDTAGNIVTSKSIGDQVEVYSAPLVLGDVVLVAPTTPSKTSQSILVGLNLDGNQKWAFVPAKK